MEQKFEHFWSAYFSPCLILFLHDFYYKIPGFLQVYTIHFSRFSRLSGNPGGDSD